MAEEVVLDPGQPQQAKVTMLSRARRESILEKTADRNTSATLGALGFPVGTIGAGATADKGRGWQAALGSLIGGTTGATAGVITGGGLANLLGSRNPVRTMRLLGALGAMGGGATGAYVGHGPKPRRKKRRK